MQQLPCEVLGSGTRVQASGTCLCNADAIVRDAHSCGSALIWARPTCVTDSDRLVIHVIQRLIPIYDDMTHDDMNTHEDGQGTPDRKGSSVAEGGASAVGGPARLVWMWEASVSRPVRTK